MQSSSLKLDKAYDLVETHWFPYDQSILDELNAKIIQEVVAKEELLSILKKDASLFLLCLKEILSTSSSPKVSENSQEVLRFLENATVEQIKQSIETIKSRPISHESVRSTNIQNQRLTEMIVSSQVVNKLSEDDIVLNEVAYTCALMKQLGLTLVAWNYPRIFEKVTCKLHSNDSLDSEFTEILGFSPVMLACTVLEKWGFPQSYVQVVSDRGSLRKIKSFNPVDEEKKDLFSRVSSICAVGEALSRATNPTLYKTAEEDIEFASDYIETFLGNCGVTKVVSSVRERLTAMSLVVPPLLLSEGRNELIQETRNKIKGSTLLYSNPYISFLPPKILKSVSNLYQDIIPSSPPYSSVSVFAKEIYPISGFSTLHVYLFDPFERKLYPSLVLGKSKLISPKSIYLKSAAGQNYILAEALKTKMPIKQSQFMEQGEELTVLAMSIGDASTVGVVYMELFQSEYEKVAVGTELDMLKYFKALKILLSDCLGLA